MPSSQNTISVKITADTAQAMQAVHSLSTQLGSLDIGYSTSRWTPAIGEGARAADRMAASMARLGPSARGGAESIQSIAGAALAVSGSTGPAAQAIRGLSSVLLMAGNDMKQFGANLKMGLGIGAAAFGADFLIGKLRELRDALRDVNTASRELDAIGSPSFAENMRKAQRAAAAQRWGELTDMSPEQRVAVEMAGDKTGSWTLQRYQKRVAQLKAADDRKREAQARQDEQQRAMQGLWDRLETARVTGIADPEAEMLARIGGRGWAMAGGGDMAKGMETLSTMWKDAREKQKKAQEQTRESAKQLADDQRAMARVYIEAMRAASTERIQALRDASEREAKEYEKQADKLHARAKRQQEKASEVWDALVEGREPSSADRREARQRERRERNLERRARETLRLMLSGEGERTTRHSREIAEAYYRRKEAEATGEAADRAARKARRAERRGEGLDEVEAGMRRGWAAEDRAAQAFELQKRMGEATAAQQSAATEMNNAAGALWLLARQLGIS